MKTEYHRGICPSIATAAVIHNNQDMETTEMSLSGSRDNDVKCVCNATVFSREKEGNPSVRNNRDRP